MNAAVSTDDVAILSAASREASLTVARKLDECMRAYGVEKNAKKDVDGVRDGTLIGADLVDGVLLDSCSG